MCRCAVRGCKRRVCSVGDNPNPHLCYKHGWWYAMSSQHDYKHLCEAEFPVWSPGDIYLWLVWTGQ